MSFPRHFCFSLFSYYTISVSHALSMFPNRNRPGNCRNWNCPHPSFDGRRHDANPETQYCSKDCQNGVFMCGNRCGVRTWDGQWGFCSKQCEDNSGIPQGPRQMPPHPPAAPQNLRAQPTAQAQPSVVQGSPQQPPQAPGTQLRAHPTVQAQPSPPVVHQDSTQQELSQSTYYQAVPEVHIRWTGYVR